MTPSPGMTPIITDLSTGLSTEVSTHLRTYPQDNIVIHRLAMQIVDNSAALSEGRDCTTIVKEHSARLGNKMNSHLFCT